MDFKENKAIYLQITDRICNDILKGIYKEEERIPSVREYAASVEVNPNTIVRSYEILQQQEIVYNKRGLGFFVSLGAVTKIHDIRKEQFLKEEASHFFEQMDLLGLSIEDVNILYKKYKKGMPA